MALASLLLVIGAFCQQLDAPPPNPQAKPDSLFKAGTVSAPRVLYKAEPEYSEEARQERIEGTVVLYVEVDPGGHAVNPRVVRSLGYGLDAKAVDAIAKWKFQPGYKDGKAVTVAATIEVSFRFARPPEQGSDDVSGLSQSLRAGTAALQQRDYEEAKNAFLEATRLDPTSRTAWNNLGRAYAGLREYDRAEAALKRQIEINPLDSFAYNNLGLVYRAQQREDTAIEYFLKQIAVNPRDPYAHANLARSYARKNQWEEARTEAITAAEITPYEARHWLRLGIAQAKTGRMGDAERSFEHALSLSSDASLENSVAYEMADAGLNFDKAWQLVNSALITQLLGICEPKAIAGEQKCAQQLRIVGATLDTAGWILYREGKWKEAVTYLSASYAIGPGIWQGLHLSASLAKAERLEEALHYFGDASSRSGFAQVDSNEVRRELTKALGGEEQFQSRLEQARNSFTVASRLARVTALVDGNGKVLDARATDPDTPDSLVATAKTLMIAPISWPEHSIRSIRTLEFHQQSSEWSLTRSYVGPPPASSTGR